MEGWGPQDDARLPSSGMSGHRVHILASPGLSGTEASLSPSHNAEPVPSSPWAPSSSPGK